MCGIVGLWDSNGSSQGHTRVLVERMRDRLVHRGPDDAGAWVAPDGQVALGQRRLSIIDLSPLGRNPMPWDGGRLWITFNGEVYNFQSLRAELEAAGYRFRSRSDTEVVLAAYDRWGVDCLARFVGMFAFGLWDAPRRRLFLARDRLGKKPLYYASYAGRFAFASELKALAADPEFPREVDREALCVYLRYGYVPAPFAIFRHARKLPPAHYAVYESGRLGVERYWDPVAIALSTREDVPEPEAEERLEALLLDAVRLRMISDVPLGAFLSGGIDSSLVVALMQEASARPVKTFTIRFENPEYNEADHAAAVARHLGTDHYEETCGADRMLGIVDAIPGFFDEPFADSSAVPTYLVSRIARQRVTVALSGDGGDELFFGYPRYHHYARRGWALGTPGLVRRLAALAASAVPRRRFQRAADVLRQEEADPYLHFIAWWGAREVEALSGRPPADNPIYAAARERLAPLPPRERPPVLDLVSYLPEDILTKVDRTSMAASLEARAPLLDHRVAEFALRLPLALKWRRGRAKRLLRRVLYKRVPRRLLERPKMGFGVPLGDWFRGPLRERMSAHLAGPLLEDLGLEPAVARALWADFLAGRRLRTELLWSLFVLMAWAEHWKSEPVGQDVPAGVPA